MEKVEWPQSLNAYCDVNKWLSLVIPLTFLVFLVGLLIFLLMLRTPFIQFIYRAYHKFKVISNRNIAKYCEKLSNTTQSQHIATYLALNGEIKVILRFVKIMLTVYNLTHGAKCSHSDKNVV